MPIQPTYPGLYIEELPSNAHTITGAPTSITVFVGYVHPFQGECARQGRWGEPIELFNFADYTRYFGELYNSQTIGRSEVGYAVDQFFLNGGAIAYVVGIEPRYYRRSNLSTSEAIGRASNSAPFSGLTFTAHEIVDGDNKLTITIRNVQTTTTANDTADLQIAYRDRAETYRAVPISGVVQALAESKLVAVAPSGAAPTSYAITGTQQSIDLVTMPGPTGFSDATPHNPRAFDKVFEAEQPLDKLEIFNLLAIPGMSDYTLSTKALHFCQDKHAFFIMDPPERATADGAGVGLDTIAELVAANTIPMGIPNGALYFPYLKSVDPVTGDLINLPPSGAVAGVYARTDETRGVWKAPAGLEATVNGPSGVVDEGRMTDMRQGQANELGINVLRSFPSIGIVVWGARTVVTKNPTFEQWRYVPVRRMALFLEQSLLRNLGWVVFEPNDEPLWRAIRLTIEEFMLSLFRQGAFFGRTPSEAFRVQCDANTTTEADINKGIVNIIVAFRPLKPAEFVIIKIAQLAGQAQS